MTTHGLAAGYLPDKLIADRLDLSLSRGDMTLLLGANGRGKSTLLRTLSGAQPASPGRFQSPGKALPTPLPPTWRASSASSTPTAPMPGI